MFCPSLIVTPSNLPSAEWNRLFVAPAGVHSFGGNLSVTYLLSPHL
jgi:hypothetical protein